MTINHIFCYILLIPLIFSGCCSWSPDGKRIASCQWYGKGIFTIRVYDIDTHTNKAVFQNRATSYTYGTLSFMPDGKHLVILTSGAGHLDTIILDALSFRQEAVHSIKIAEQDIWDKYISPSSGTGHWLLIEDDTNVWIPTTNRNSLAYTQVNIKDGEQKRRILLPKERLLSIDQGPAGIFFISQSLSGKRLYLNRIDLKRRVSVPLDVFPGNYLNAENAFITVGNHHLAITLYNTKANANNSVVTCITNMRGKIINKIILDTPSACVFENDDKAIWITEGKNKNLKLTRYNFAGIRLADVVLHKVKDNKTATTDDLSNAVDSLAVGLALSPDDKHLAVTIPNFEKRPYLFIIDLTKSNFPVTTWPITLNKNKPQ